MVIELYLPTEKPVACVTMPTTYCLQVTFNFNVSFFPAFRSISLWGSCCLVCAVRLWHWPRTNKVSTRLLKFKKLSSMVMMGISLVMAQFVWLMVQTAVHYLRSSADWFVGWSSWFVGWSSWFVGWSSFAVTGFLALCDNIYDGVCHGMVNICC
jgi:hypothetical protein